MMWVWVLLVIVKLSLLSSVSATKTLNKGNFFSCALSTYICTFYECCLAGSSFTSIVTNDGQHVLTIENTEGHTDEGKLVLYRMDGGDDVNKTKLWSSANTEKAKSVLFTVIESEQS